MTEKRRHRLITYDYDEIGPSRFSFTSLLRELFLPGKSNPYASRYTKKTSQYVQKSKLGEESLTVDLLARPLLEVLSKIELFRSLCHTDADESVLQGFLGSIIRIIDKAAQLSDPVCGLRQRIPRKTPSNIKGLLAECASLQDEFVFLVTQVQWMKKDKRMIQVLAQPRSPIEEEMVSKANNALDAIYRRVYGILQLLALVKLSFASDLELAQLLKSEKTSVAA